MPLVKDQAGKFALVCLNGCTPTSVTKGFIALVKEEVLPRPDLPPALIAAGIGEVQSTMRHAGGWNALTGVDPPRPMPSHMPGILPAPEGLKAPPVFRGGHGVPVRLYFCQACGYVELYVAEILDPAMWKI